MSTDLDRQRLSGAKGGADREPNPDALSLCHEQLLTVEQVAAVTALSPSGVRKAHAAGRLPLPIRIGRSVRWSARELDAWIAAGCPERGRWIEMKKAARGREAK